MEAVSVLRRRGHHRGKNALPDFKGGRLYLVRGATLNDILTEQQMNRPCCVEGGGLSIESSTDAGTFLRKVVNGGGGETPDPAEGMPDFDDDKVYLLTPETLSK